jgi:hypothetical protein
MPELVLGPDGLFDLYSRHSEVKSITQAVQL